MKIMISNTGSAAAQNLIRYLKTHTNWTVIAADASAFHGGLGLADLDVIIPRGDSPDYAPQVLKLIEDHNLHMFIPVM